MDLENRLDLFEPGDQTALVCLDVPEVQRIVVDQVSELGYKIHTGLFVEDILLKMRAHVYDLVVVSANFNASSTEANPIMSAALHAPASQRRRQIIVLIGSQLTTNDEIQAFGHSVDLVVGLADVVNLRPIIRRAVTRHQDLYNSFFDAEKYVQAL